MKPHYALLPAILLVLAARHRPRRALWPEVLGFAVVAAAQALVLALRYPDWFQVARCAADLYGAFHGTGWSRMLQARGMILGAAALGLQLALMTRDRAFRGSAWPLVVAAVYAWLAYLVQFKGWDYQFIPACTFTLAGLGLALAGQAAPDGRAWRLAAAGLAAVAVLQGGDTWLRRTPDTASLGKVPEALAIAGKGSSVYAFSLEVSPMFPAVSLLGLRWASRYSHLWPLPALFEAQQENSAAGRALIARYQGPLVQSVLDDFGRFRPELVVVDRHPVAAFGAGYDILAPFLADPRFAHLWSGYRLIGSFTYPGGSYGYELYVNTRQ
jgi:hypothetical protein